MRLEKKRGAAPYPARGNAPNPRSFSSQASAPSRRSRLKRLLCSAPGGILPPVTVFSTCWNSSRHKDGGALCDEIRELGFDSIEASHGLSLSLMPGIIRAVEEKRICVVGVHNFCPSPIDVHRDAPDAFQFTSHRPEERERAMRLSLETLQVAARLEARYVVLHMGMVHLFLNFESTKEMERMVRHGLAGTREYARLKGEFVRKRRRLAPLYFARAREALHTLAEKAQELGLVLGVEGRSHFEQIPGEEEVLLLMQEFEGNPHVRYWHDFGHIQRKHNLLMLDHAQYLDTLRPHLYGAHVNDVQWPARDHRVPLCPGGTVDFRQLLPRFFTADMPLTWELSPSVTQVQIREALPAWRALEATLPAGR